MNRKQLVAEVAATTGLPLNAVNAVTTAILDHITKAVAAGDKVSLTGFGSFEQTYKPSRMAQVPGSSRQVKVEESWAPKFRPGSEFKTAVNEGGRLTVKAAA